tara:strand:+ start:990 stop:1229 length:240 start_codon:yes stop_codon:yes gene_type:complete
MNIFVKISIGFIKSYKYLISPLLGNSCRYFPTCSDYSVEAFKTYGFLKGFYMSIIRVLSCNPFKEGGIDPVVKKNNLKR